MGSRVDALAKIVADAMRQQAKSTQAGHLLVHRAAVALEMYVEDVAAQLAPVLDQMLDGLEWECSECGADVPPTSSACGCRPPC